jgi:hypothetical protein
MISTIFELCGLVKIESVFLNGSVWSSKYVLVRDFFFPPNSTR